MRRNGEEGEVPQHRVPLGEKPKKSIIGSFLGRIHRSKSRGNEKGKKTTTQGESGGVSLSRSEYDVKGSESNENMAMSQTVSDGHLAGHTSSSAESDEKIFAKPSPARRILNRISFRHRSKDRVKLSSGSSEYLDSTPIRQKNIGFAAGTTSEHDLRHAIIRSNEGSSSGGAVGAVSEMDLRFVTSRDEHLTIPLDESFGFGERSPRGFVSESDLTSGNIDTGPAPRTPSYLRISCALNGYTRSPKREENSELTSAATRAMGESLVERRLKMFSQPQQKRREQFDEFGSPCVSTSASSSLTSAVESTSTPLPLSSTPFHNTRLQTIRHDAAMGNNVSTPGPIKDLISKFDKLELCGFDKSTSSEKEGVENIAPHSIVVNQPDFDDVESIKKEGKILDTHPNIQSDEVTSSSTPESEGSETAENRNIMVKPAPSSRISVDVESDSGISGSGNYSPESTKREEAERRGGEEEGAKEVAEISSSTTDDVDCNPKDAAGFRRLHDHVKADLLKKMADANVDLERVDDLPDACADALRAANGNAQLLVRKKFARLSELIDKNLNPIADDPKSVTVDDLVGFWATIDMELTAIQKEFAKVEKFRAANWSPDAVKAVEEAEKAAEKEATRHTTTAPQRRPAAVAAKKTPPALSAEAKEKLEKQRAAAEERRAAMRQQMREKMMANKKKEDVDVGSEC